MCVYELLMILKYVLLYFQFLLLQIKAYCTNSKVSEVSQVSKATQTFEATLCSEEQYYEQGIYSVIRQLNILCKVRTKK